MRFWIKYLDELDDKIPVKEAYLDAEHAGDLRLKFFKQSIRGQEILDFDLLKDQKNKNNLKPFNQKIKTVESNFNFNNTNYQKNEKNMRKHQKNLKLSLKKVRKLLIFEIE